MTTAPLRVAVVGPLLALAGRARAPGQGELLAAALRRRGHEVVATSSVEAPLGRLLDAGWTLFRLRRQVDVVVLLVFSGRGFVFAELVSSLVERLRRPLVLWLHGGGLPAFSRRQGRRTRRVFARAAALVAPSVYLRRELAQLADVEVVGNLLPEGVYPFRERRPLRPRLLWLRTFHPIYRPEVALEALERLRRVRPEATLTLAGHDEGALAAVSARAAPLGDAVRLAGFLDAEAKARALDDHDVFLHTNAVDNAPVSLLEAGAAGLPIVATAVGGVADLVRDGESALLVDDGPPDVVAGRLADAVARLLADPALAARLVAGGRALAAEARPERVLPRWEALLSRLGSGAGSAR